MQVRRLSCDITLFIHRLFNYVQNYFIHLTKLTKSSDFSFYHFVANIIFKCHCIYIQLFTLELCILPYFLTAIWCQCVALIYALLKIMQFKMLNDGLDLTNIHKWWHCEKCLAMSFEWIFDYHIRLDWLKLANSCNLSDAHQAIRAHYWFVGSSQS